MYVPIGQWGPTAAEPMTSQSFAPTMVARPYAMPASPAPATSQHAVVEPEVVDDGDDGSVTEEPDTMLLWGGLILLAALAGGGIYLYTRKKR